MSQLAYLNGRLIPENELSISVFDVGFVQGVTVSEQLRTFSGVPFSCDRHFARLERSLQIVGVNGIDLSALEAAARDLVAYNHNLIDEGDDLGLTIFVTPGQMPLDSKSGPSAPTVGIHTRPLPFKNWFRKYSEGDHLVVSDVRQIPASCWSPELKCRSRMHYYLADQQAQQKVPGARALLLDQDGYLAEASTASIIMYRVNEGLIAPSADRVLPGVSMATLYSLANRIGIKFTNRRVTIDELRDADEVLMCSTSPCVWPVATIDGVSIGRIAKNSVCCRLLTAWSETVNVDIVEQARQFSNR